MVSYDKNMDQFGSLLSNVSGVDSGAFQKRALKDVKATDTSKDRSKSSSQGQARHIPEYGIISDMSRGPSNSQQKPRPSARSFSNAPSAANEQGSKYSYNTSPKSTATQFDSIFGDLDSSKQSRYEGSLMKHFRLPNQDRYIKCLLQARHFLQAYEEAS